MQEWVGRVAVALDLPAELAQLNAIVHPRTWEKIDADLTEYRRAHPAGIAVVDIALLATSERRDAFDLNVVVHADTETRIRRLTQTRGMDEKDARARIAAQVDEDELREAKGGDAPAFTLSTLEGPLQLSGNGQWVGARLRFSGEATAAPEQQAQLANLLNIIGRRQGARSLLSIG